MNKPLRFIASLSFLLLFSLQSSAVTEFGQDITPTVIFGSGNANGSFTTTRVNGIELGLRAKIPFNGNINSSQDGKYHYSLAETDDDNDPMTPNRWNFDWTINTDYDFSNGNELDAFTYELGLDVDPSINKNFLIFDPVTPTQSVPVFDHSLGNNTTGNGEGTVTNDPNTYVNLLSSQNVLQQSWRYAFFDDLAPMDTYDASVEGTYHIYLLARDAAGNVVARTEIVVEITDNGFVTPEVIFGSGNTNGNFTVETAGDVEVGLRAKIPYDGNINYNGDGTYSYTLDETNDPDDIDPRRWNFDWTINTDFNDPNSTGDKINSYTYELGLDADPSTATDFLIFDPITTSDPNQFFDHTFGDNNTANGSGTVATDGPSYNALVSSSNVVQQSWRYAFFDALPPLTGYNPDVAGNYIVYLAVKDDQGAEIARTEIQVLIGGAPKRTVPVAIDDDYFTFEDFDLIIPTATGLLSNDADADQDTLTIANPGMFTGVGIGGTFNLAEDGGFVYTPPADANGLDTLQYQLTDGLNEVSAVVVVNVRAVNDKPTFSILGDFELNSLDQDSSTFIIDDFTFDYDFGPADESGQSIESIDVEVVSDSDDVLNEIIMTDFGTLIFDLNLNYGTAILNVVVQDDGGNFTGEAVSDPVPFTISYLDLIFANGFDPVGGFKLLSFLDKMSLVEQQNAEISYDELKPYYDFPSNSIHFLGHSYKLYDDYNSEKIAMTIYQWMEEVIHSENLSIKIK